MTTKREELRVCIGVLELAIERKKRLEADQEETQRQINYLIAMGDTEDAEGIKRLSELNSKALLFPNALRDAEAHIRQSHATVHQQLRDCCSEAREISRAKVNNLESAIMALVFADAPPRSREDKEAVKRLANCSYWADWFNAFQSLITSSHSHAKDNQILKFETDLGNAHTLFQWLPKFEAGKPRR